jgi:septum site-determining protein MinC
MSDASGAVDEMFATETMAELCVRQGRLADAVAIFARLVERRGDDARAGAWAARLAALRAQPVGASQPPPPPRPPAAERPIHRMPMLVTRTVRAGEIVYAEAADLVVVGTVNPGAELVADGHVHVYGALRGRAVAGARGARDARVFCRRLEAELVGVDGAYLTFENLPPALRGAACQVRLAGDHCTVEPLASEGDAAARAGRLTH